MPGSVRSSGMFTALLCSRRRLPLAKDYITILPFGLRPKRRSNFHADPASGHTLDSMGRFLFLPTVISQTLIMHLGALHSVPGTISLHLIQ